jgi:hypothetical protein
VPVGIEVPPTTELRPRVRLAAAPLAAEAVSAAAPLAPPAPTRRADLDDGSVRILEHDLAPTVDVAPESLRTQAFAVRVARCTIPHVEPPVRAPLLEDPAIASVRPLDPPVIRRGVPEAARSLRLRPRPTEQVERDVLRECLTSLFRASGTNDASDLRLVGIFAPAPVGAIASVALGEDGVQVRVAPRASARPGMLVVGRRRSSGALVTAEVGPTGELAVSSR